MIQQVLPDPRPLAADEIPDLATRLRASRATPFAETTVQFCAALAQRLLRHKRAREFPELLALGFFLRRTELTRLAAEHVDAAGDRVLVPRGVAFHVPPANVDTIFVYSWLLSALAGNSNVVRLPSRRGEATEVLLDTVGELLAEHPDVAAATSMVEYGHDDDVNAALSIACDVRVLWGGDETISRLRAFPLLPGAIEMTFPNRFSYAAMGAEFVANAGEEELATLAERFTNDAYWFDQAGCSSPRMIVWVGSDDAAGAAGDRFYGALAEHLAQRHIDTPLGLVLAKHGFAFDSVIGDDVTHVAFKTNDLTVLRLHSLESFRRLHPGGGLFYEYVVGEIEDLVGFVEPVDQTLTVAGIPAEQVRRFAQLLNGGGLDRIVAVGDALSFSRYWDGFDLLRTFSRQVSIPAEVS